MGFCHTEPASPRKPGNVIELAAVALGRLGGLKGGTIRANVVALAALA